MLIEEHLGRSLSFAELASFLEGSTSWAGDISYALHLRGVTGILVVTNSVQYSISKNGPGYFYVDAM